MFGIGVQELGLILVVALLVLGPKRMPELARMLGRGMGEFRKASNDLRQSLAIDEIQNEIRGATGSIKKELSEVREGIQQPLKQAAPEPDRPAQAGDDLGPTAAAAATAAADAVVETAADAQANAADTTPAPQETRPGELPLGDDHAHHDFEESSLDSLVDDEEGAAAETAASDRDDTEPKRG